MKKSRIDAAWTGKAECGRCGIRDLVLFADLAEPDFNLIHLPIEERELDVESVLYSAGQDGSALFTVRTGLVKLVQYLPEGTLRIVRLLGPGATAGLEALLGQPYEHSAVVLQRALVCRIPRQVVERLSTETPRLHGQLMQRWHGALKQADDWLTGLSTGKTSQRLARLLLHVMDQDGNAPLFSREDLGAMLGVTTVHASRTVAEFKRNGVLREPKSGRCICDRARLECIATAEC
ncbi:Crp/Fnr family transcriptional regulator [Magnetospirillum sp. UT-4]|uniref:Crp/Fnr family transcriptional regulator n=1 Tax=Magnetospirillum sp. UT-4 TaxID=2681467 RepID=UPI0013828265|nr:Crp/Fnr family transcriptional regulator [Magnetospirillum sp. UT-4]CAA7615330.1 Transcriptional regulator, Crp/Fnr family [Magnetospirillum sp. UT-4]